VKATCIDWTWTFLEKHPVQNRERARVAGILLFQFGNVAMSVRLGDNSYGESGVRFLRVVRQQGRHDVKEITVDVGFEGEFEEAHSRGDNRKILPADTMKNTVYVLARQYPVEALEEFCLHLMEHFLTYNPQVARVHVLAKENLWSRIPLGGKPHAHAFALGSERRTAALRGTRQETVIRAGIENLIVLKTAKSAFEKFMRDPYTTLKDDPERMLSTAVQADWQYDGGVEIEFGPTWHGARQAMLETFADHDSRSLQHTLQAMGRAVLESFDNIREIHLALPDRYYNLADLAPFGLDNPVEVFIPAVDRSGAVEATLRKE
jgi:urate oxidase